MIAYVPLPSVFPVLYCARGTDIRGRVGEREKMRDTWQGTDCMGGMMFVSFACVNNWIQD